MFVWAIESGHTDKDPTAGVKQVVNNSAGHHTWTPDEISQFEAKHPVGSQARLALSLMLFTACRREDVVRLGPQHVKQGRIKFVQAKNENRRPVTVDIPLHPTLAATIAATPSTGQLAFLTSSKGTPRTVGSFADWFAGAVQQAGLPARCVSHGLRKAAATRMAEAGCSVHEIQSVTGHASLREVARYTKAASAAKLADAAMSKLATK